MEWTGARYGDKPTVEVQTWIDAPPHRVWEIVSDVELMPTMSSELQSVEWLDGACGPSVGARFIGRSKHEALGEWSTTSHVIECESQRVLAWAVEDPQNPTAIWRFRLEPKNGGTELSQWMQMGPARSGLSFAIDRMPDKEQRSCSCGCASSSRTWPRRLGKSRSWRKADAYSDYRRSLWLRTLVRAKGFRRRSRENRS